MFSGYFFLYDLKASTDERPLFRYKKVERHNTTVNAWEDVADTYPLYVTLEPERIVFNINLDERYAENNPADGYSLYHTRVLQLPVTTWNSMTDEMSRRVVSIFAETSAFTHYTNVKINHNFENIEDASDQSSHAQSTLDRVGAFFSNPYDLLWDRTAPHHIHPNLDKLLVTRELFLDFLFDFLHTDVFKQFKGYANLKTRLNEHFLWQSIVNKCNYYYWRDQFVQSETGNKAYLCHTAWELWKAEDLWLHTLRNENAVTLYRSNGWVKNAHAELEYVLLNSKNFNPKINLNTAPQQSFSRKKWLHYISKSAANNDKSFYPVTREEFTELARNTKDQTFQHLMSRFAISSCYKWVANEGGNKLYRLFNPRLISIAISLFYILLLLLFICGDKSLFWTQISHSKDFETPLRHIMLDAMKAALTLLSVLGLADMIVIPIGMFILGIFRHYCKKNHLPLVYHPCIAMPNMTLAIMAGWLSYIPISNDAWSMNVQLNPSPLFFTWITAAFFTMAVTAFSIRNLTPELTPWQAIKKALVVFIKGFSLSIFCGVVIMHQLHRIPLSEPAKYLPDDLNTALQVPKPTSEPLTNFVFKPGEISFESTSPSDSVYIKPLPLPDSIGPTDIVQYDSLVKAMLNQKHLLACVKDCTRERTTAWSFINHRCIPSIDTLNFGFLSIFIFPKLLITYAAITFFLGFFIELAFQTRVFKGPV